jgi:HEAT repeat protein
MKPARGSTILHSGLLVLALLGLGYWTWQRYHQPAVPTYEGKPLADWINDLNDPDYTVSGRAADVLVRVGADAVPVLLEARTSADIRLHRRAVAALIRIGAPAASGLVAALKDGANHRAETALVRLGPAATPALIDALKDEKVSQDAARVLGLMGARATDAVPALIELLKDRHAAGSLRAAAAETLGLIGTPEGDIVAALLAALTEDKPEVRRGAAAALNWMGPPARSAAPALVAAVRDDDEKTAAAACQALARLGDAGVAPALFAALRSKRGVVADAALQALWQMGPNAKSIVPGLVSLLDTPPGESARIRALLATLGPVAVPQLTAALQDKEPKIRQAAIEMLGLIGPVARSAAPAVAAAIKDKTPNVALAAAIALTRLDPTRARDADAVPLLADALDHLPSLRALADIGPDARAAVPALVAALKHKDKAVRDGARRALACIGTPAVPALIDALKDNTENVAGLAAQTLGSILPRPKEALPALREALQHEACRAAAAAALARIDPGASAEVVSLLLAELKREDLTRQHAALEALSRLGPAAQPTVPALTEILKDPALREAALEALGAIGPEARSAVPAILLLPREMGEKIAGPVRRTLARMGAPAVPEVAALLKDRDPRFRRFALAILATLGPSARTILPSLVPLLEDSDTDVRASAAQLIGSLGTDAAEAVPALVANLQTYQSQARAAAASALGHLGAAAKEARPALVECLLDPDVGVRYAAALSLGRIDPHYVECVPALSDALNDAAAMVRLAAIDSLTIIEPARVEDLVPMLLDLSGKPDTLDVRFRAVVGLTRYASAEARKFVPWLIVELNEVDPAIRLEAATLLARIEPERTRQTVLAVLPTLTSLLRAEIARALGSLGPKAREAVPALLPLLQDDVPEVRQATREALRSIDPARAKQLGID